MAQRALFTGLFWLDTAERLIKSFAQGAILAMGQDAIGWDKFQATASSVLLSGLAMAVLSLFTSIGSAGVSSSVSPASAVPTQKPVGDRGDISLVNVLIAVLIFFVILLILRQLAYV